MAEIKVLAVVSREGVSSKSGLSLPEDRVLSVGDVIESGKEKLKITAIQTSQGDFLPSSSVSNMMSIYCVPRFPIKVPASVHKLDGSTDSLKVEFSKDLVLKKGTHLKSDGALATISKITTAEGEAESAKASKVLSLNCWEKR